MSFPINLMSWLNGSWRIFELIRRCKRKRLNRFGEGLFDAIEDGEQVSTEYFENWIKKIQETIPEERLLIYNVKDGWSPLCKFLDMPLPNVAFPNVNDKKKMDMRYWKRKATAYLGIVVMPIVISLTAIIFGSYLKVKTGA